MVSDDATGGPSASQSHHHHTELLDRATEAMIRALEELKVVAGEMAALLSHPGAATAGIDEEHRCGALHRLELRAHRRYHAARRWHDNIRRRSLQIEVPVAPGWAGGSDRLMQDL